MPDFNYGDFTQQGIENKVTLKARLNERRYVTLDLQSDVEGPNLTISGNVHDELNNIDYSIGSAPNGNIEITENGENINVAPFATATVNVSGGGDSDFSTVTIALYNPDEVVGGIAVACLENDVLLPFANVYGVQERTANVILYKGTVIYQPSGPLTVDSVTGNITWDNEEEIGVISGVGTITVKPINS